MKKLMLLLIVLFCQFGNAQELDLNLPETQKPRLHIPEPVKVISLYVGAIVLEGIGDALYDDGDKALGKSLQAISLGMLLLSPAILDMNRDNWWWYVITYTSFRVALFDYTYNATRGLPLNTVGTTSYWDKGIEKVGFEAYPGAQLFTRGIFFTLAITIPINEL